MEAQKYKPKFCRAKHPSKVLDRLLLCFFRPLVTSSSASICAGLLPESPVSFTHGALPILLEKDTVHLA